MTFVPAALETDVAGLTKDPRLTIRLDLRTGEKGLARPIRHPRVQKSGLALAGHYHGVVPTRVQLLGETEISYLESLAPEARSLAARGFLALGLSCIVITGNRPPPPALQAACEATDTPLFVSPEKTSRTVNAIHDVLDDRLAPRSEIHGVLVDVFGVGLLLLGKSGIGKSECAVELVLRGHRFIADDIVACDYRPPGMVFGAPKDLLRHHVELRGLGVLNIHEMFGVTSTRDRKRIDMVVKLEEWNESGGYDRLGLDPQFFNILGVQIRMLTVPVRPARDMGAILEIAARNELLRRDGKNPAEDFVRRLEGRVDVRTEGRSPDPRIDSGMPRLIPARSSPIPGIPFPLPPSSATVFERSSRPDPRKEPDDVPSQNERILRTEAPALGPNESSAWIPVQKPISKPNKGDG
jgi:HPr kinase/phosphorylase